MSMENVKFIDPVEKMKAMGMSDQEISLHHTLNPMEGRIMLLLKVAQPQNYSSHLERGTLKDWIEIMTERAQEIMSKVTQEVILETMPTNEAEKIRSLQTAQINAWDAVVRSLVEEAEQTN